MTRQAVSPELSGVIPIHNEALAEVQARTCHESQDKPVCVIREVLEDEENVGPRMWKN